jgi:signal peptidase I
MEHFAQNHQAAASPPRRRERLRNFLSAFRFLATVVLMVGVLVTFVLQSYQVFGQSMAPTLHDGDRLIISKIGKTYARALGRHYVPKRGDIVVFDDPFVDRHLIKRVIGLPGERVTLQNGSFVIYTDEHPEGFNPDENSDYGDDISFTVGTVDVTVPAGQIFVTGDNRGPSGSTDSRNELGTIPVERVSGSLFLRLFPVTDVKVFW